MQRKKVLITGAAGFLGSHLCDRFIKENYRVIAMDNLITGDLKNIQHLFQPATTIALLAAIESLLCAVVAGHTTFYGLPTASTLSALGRAWTAGLDSFRNAVAPTKVTPGLLLLSVGGTWVCAAAADWLAFRGDATLTAILPPFVLYVMGAALGKDGFQLPTTFVFVVAALLFVAANHAAGLPSAWQNRSHCASAATEITTHSSSPLQG